MAGRLVFISFAQALLAWRLLEGERAIPGSEAAEEYPYEGAWRKDIPSARTVVTLLLISIVISNIVFFNLVGDRRFYGVLGSIEIGLYAGFAGEFATDFGYDVGLVYYTYPDSDGNKAKCNADGINCEIKAYPEIYGALSGKWFEVNQWYSNDNSGSDEDSFYTEGNASFELPANFGLNLHLGYYYGDYFDSPDPAFEDSDYMDYSSGVAYSLGNFDLELKWVDNNMDEDAYFYTEGDVFNTEGRAIFSVSTTFLRSKDW